MPDDLSIQVKDAEVNPSLTLLTLYFFKPFVGVLLGKSWLKVLRRDTPGGFRHLPKRMAMLSFQSP